MHSFIGTLQTHSQKGHFKTKKDGNGNSGEWLKKKPTENYNVVHRPLSLWSFVMKWWSENGENQSAMNVSLCDCLDPLPQGHSNVTSGELSSPILHDKSGLILSDYG